MYDMVELCPVKVPEEQKLWKIFIANFDTFQKCIYRRIFETGWGYGISGSETLRRFWRNKFSFAAEKK